MGSDVDGWHRTFGKGLTPKAYRLSLLDVQANAEKIMMEVSSTRMPYAPDRLQEKKVRDWELEDEKEDLPTLPWEMEDRERYTGFVDGRR